MFLKFFGLKDHPFKLGFDPARLFLGRHHEEALAHLRYAVAEGEGFSVITGAYGVGKSAVCRAFVESLKSGATVSFLTSPIAGPQELLQRMNRSFGIPAAAQTTPGLIDALNAFLMRERVSGRKVAVFIDDAQLLSPEVLEQVRLISNLETTREKLIQIVLVGEPELLQLLNSHTLRQMGQRVSVCYEIGPLTADETAAYIQHRLSISSTGPPVRFSREAVRHVFRHTRGNPRGINIACSAILAAAFKERRREVTGDQALAVTQEISPTERRGFLRPGSARWPAWALAACGGALLAAGAFFAFRPAPQTLRPGPAAAEPRAAAPVGTEQPAPTPPPADASLAGPEAGVPGSPAATAAEPRLEPPDGAQRPVMTHSVQVGAYLQPENAQKMAAQLVSKGYPARIVKITDAKGRTWHMVRIGDHPNLQAAQAQAEEFSRREHMQSVVRSYGAY